MDPTSIVYLPCRNQSIWILYILHLVGCSQFFYTNSRALELFSDLLFFNVLKCISFTDFPLFSISFSSSLCSVERLNKKFCQIRISMSCFLLGSISIWNNSSFYNVSFFVRRFGIQIKCMLSSQAIVSTKEEEKKMELNPLRFSV